MKKLFAATLLLAAVAAHPAAVSAQNKPAAAPAPEAPRYEYCEVRMVGDDVYADFGYGSEKLGGPELSKLEAGKLQVFATPISALNYMGSLGWEVLQVVHSSAEPSLTRNGTKGNRYFVLRRLRSSTGISVTR